MRYLFLLLLILTSCYNPNDKKLSRLMIVVSETTDGPSGQSIYQVHTTWGMREFLAAPNTYNIGDTLFIVNIKDVPLFDSIRPKL